jgi:hypothetical protein
MLTRHSRLVPLYASPGVINHLFEVRAVAGASIFVGTMTSFSGVPVCTLEKEEAVPAESGASATWMIPMLHPLSGRLW